MTDPSTTRLENTSDDFTGQTNTHIPESFGSSRELWVVSFSAHLFLGCNLEFPNVRMNLVRELRSNDF